MEFLPIGVYVSRFEGFSVWPVWVSWGDMTSNWVFMWTLIESWALPALFE